MRIVLVSLVVHGLLFVSIFDIYFRSPVEHGMLPQYPTYGPPPAKRLVLFVADGLRADTFYSLDNSEETLAPYLRSIVETRGENHTFMCIGAGYLVNVAGTVGTVLIHKERCPFKGTFIYISM